MAKRKPQEQRHQKQVRVYLTDEQLEQVKALSVIKKQKSSEVIRGIVDDYLERIRQ